MIFYGFLSLVLAAIPAHMASPCVPATEMHKIFQHHKEEPRGRGLSQDGGALVELWVSPDGSFSITARSATGTMCMILAGHGWQAVEPGDQI